MIKKYDNLFQSKILHRRRWFLQRVSIIILLLADRQPSFMVMLSAAIDDAVDIVTRPVDETGPRPDDEVSSDWTRLTILIYLYMYLINQWLLQTRRLTRVVIS